MKTRLCFLFFICTMVSCSTRKTVSSFGKSDNMNNMSFVPVDWSHSTNIYEVNLRQYTKEGNFAAFAREMPRLRKMGVEVLWFMPITPISEKGRKGSLGSYYACSNYTDTNPEYGSVADFKQLVAEAHTLGFKVIIDWVANHTGAGHVWTQSHPDYYIKNEKGEFYDKHGWDDVIDLDFGNHQMRKDLIEAMRFWVRECNIDGFRCDMAMLVPLDFWKEARTSLDKDKKLFWLAESEEVNYHEAFDVTYTWEWMHKSEDFVKQKTDRAGLDSILWKYHHQFPANAMRVYFTSNHDENSWNGTEFEKFGDAAKALAVFSATWNGIPMLYSGQELPNTKRLKFFDRDPIEWNGHYALENFYTTLLNLHKNHPALAAADPQVRTGFLKTSEPEKILAYSRIKGNEEVIVILNLSPEDHLQFSIEDPVSDAMYKNAFDGSVEDIRFGKSYRFDAWGYKVLVRQP